MSSSDEETRGAYMKKKTKEKLIVGDDENENAAATASGLDSLECLENWPMCENNFEKISTYYTDLKAYNDTTDGKKRAGIRMKPTKESEKFTPHKKLDMKKEIDGRLKLMNEFYQSLMQSLNNIQNSPVYNTRLEACEKKLIDVKAEFDKK